MSRELTLEEIRGLLRELIRRLESDGLAITIRLVGGAAIALSGHSRRVTRDVDASYSATDTVEQIIAAIADERGLPTNWLNSSAAAFIPSGATWNEINLGDGHHAFVASLDTLLAMKLSSARQRDMEDISFLVAALGIEDPNEAVRIAEELYGDDDVAYSPVSREDAPIVALEAIEQAHQDES